MTDPDICIHCRCYWRAGHTDACPQVTDVYPVTAAEDGIVCAGCHSALVGHWTTVDSVIYCLGCAAHAACADRARPCRHVGTITPELLKELDRPMTTRTVNYLDLTPDERKRARLVRCGLECLCEDPKTGITIGKMDYVGDPYPDATNVILDKRTNEWVVYVYDETVRMDQREAARYPVADVEAIRYAPNDARLYSHYVIDEELDEHGKQAREAVEQ